jgi:putative serine protease PepD
MTMIETRDRGVPDTPRTADPAAHVWADTTDGTGIGHLPPAGPQAPQAPEPPDRPRRRRRTLVLASGLAVLTLVSSAGGGLVVSQLLDRSDSATVTSAVISGDVTASGSLADVVAAVRPSVVSVAVSNGSSAGEGAGVILGSDGLILTNNHVVASAADGGTITVTFSDGTATKATIVGHDPSSDIAVIQAQGVSGLRPATLGSVDDLAVGQTVLAIGNPLGLDESVTSGIVSALNREIQIGGGDGGSEGTFGRGRSTTTTLKDAIQTDAAINPGNSGGALVDGSGRVVGITTANAGVSGTSSGSIGVGFAIPIDTAYTVAQRLISN